MAKGKKTGGRTAGTLNVATRERAMIAEQVTQRAAMTGRKLAKEVLDDFMTVFAGMAAAVQPKFDASGLLVSGDISEFERWAIHATNTAAMLAKYQSPTYRAVHLTQESQPIIRGAADEKTIDLIASKNPTEGTETYLRLVRADPKVA